MKENNDKPAPISFKSSAKNLSFDEIDLTTKLYVTDNVDDFWFEKNEYRTPNTLDYEVSADNKTIILKEYPGKSNESPPQLVFYFDTKPMLKPLYNKDFELNIVFPEIAKKIYKTGDKALSVQGLRCMKKPQLIVCEEQETDKGIIYFPDIKPKL